MIEIHSIKEHPVARASRYGAWWMLANALLLLFVVDDLKGVAYLISVLMLALIFRLMANHF